MSRFRHLNRQVNREALLACVFLFAGFASYLMPLALYSIALPFSVAALAWAGRPAARRLADTLALPAAVLLPAGILAVISALWSIAPEESLVRGMRLLAELAVFVLLMALAGCAGPRLQKRIAMASAIGLTISAALMVLDVTLGYPLTGWARSEAGRPVFYAQGANITAFLLAPLAVALWTSGYRVGAGLFIAANLAAVFTSVNVTAQFALIVGCLLFAAVYLVPRLRWLVAAGALAIMLVFSSVGVRDAETACPVLEILPPSALHRVTIYDYAHDLIAERPWLGYGMDTSRVIGRRHVQRKVACLDERRPAMPLHPHNATLQLRLELGVLGPLFGAVIMATLFWCGDRLSRSRAAKGALTAAFGAAFITSQLGFGIWQGWLLAAFALGVVMVRAALVALERGCGGGEEAVATAEHLAGDT